MAVRLSGPETVQQPYQFPTLLSESGRRAAMIFLDYL